MMVNATKIARIFPENCYAMYIRGKHFAIHFATESTIEIVA